MLKGPAYMKFNSNDNQEYNIILLLYMLKKAAEFEFKIGNIMRGQLSARLLSLHNRASVADSRSAFTSYRLRYKSACKNWAFIYLLSPKIKLTHLN